MPKGVRISVDISEYIEVLRSMPAKIQRNAVMSALRKGARFVVKELKARTPKRTGATRKGIKAGRVRQSGPVFEVGISRPIIFNILESGAQSYDISPRRKKALVFNGVFAAKVQHPGFPGLGPIFDIVTREKESEIVRIFGQQVDKVVIEAMAAVK